MKKLPIKAIVEFRRRKSDKTKATFLNSLKVEKEKKDDDPGGGDYWITSLSALANTYKSQPSDLRIIKSKIKELKEKQENTQILKAKNMYQRNIDILGNYERSDFGIWKPKDIQIFKKENANSIVPLKGLPVQALPHHLFKFNDNREVGAIWFIAKLKGYTKDELGMFSEALYRYLKMYYKEDYVINPRYCIAVDVCNQFDVNYEQIQMGEVARLLGKTIDEINRLL